MSRNSLYLQVVLKGRNRKKNESPTWLIVLGIDLAYELMSTECLPGAVIEGVWGNEHYFGAGCFSAQHCSVSGRQGELMPFISLLPCGSWSGRVLGWESWVGIAAPGSLSPQESRWTSGRGSE